jgi:hypothetical protein
MPPRLPVAVAIDVDNCDPDALILVDVDKIPETDNVEPKEPVEAETEPAPPATPVEVPLMFIDCPLINPATAAAVAVL